MKKNVIGQINWKYYHVRYWKRKYTEWKKIQQSIRAKDFDTLNELIKFLINKNPKEYRIKIYENGEMKIEL